MLAIEEPEIAKELKKKILGSNTEIDKALAEPDVPLDEIKFYPGSDKGPTPEDDPESYSRWFVEN